MKTALDRKSMRPAEAALVLGISRDTVYTLLRARRLRSIKVGAARLIPISAIDDFLNSGDEYA